MAQRLSDDQLPHIHPEGHDPALEEWHACLRALHEQGLLRLLRATISATPQLAERVVMLLNNPAGLRVSNNMTLLLQAAGRIEPEELQRVLKALTMAVDLAGAGYAGGKPSRSLRVPWWRLARALRWGLGGFIAGLTGQATHKPR